MSILLSIHTARFLITLIETWNLEKPSVPFTLLSARGDNFNPCSKVKRQIKNLCSFIRLSFILFEEGVNIYKPMFDDKEKKQICTLK